MLIKDNLETARRNCLDSVRVINETWKRADSWRAFAEWFNDLIVDVNYLLDRKGDFVGYRLQFDLYDEGKSDTWISEFYQGNSAEVKFGFDGQIWTERLGKNVSNAIFSIVGENCKRVTKN